VAPDTIWEIVFLMVILKIPIVYLCFVVWYAIRAKPHPGPGDALGVRADPGDSGPGWGRRSRPRRLGPRRPHGGPARTYPRTPRTAFARAGRVERR
jgi:hypothetical protein